MVPCLLLSCYQQTDPSNTDHYRPPHLSESIKNSLIIDPIIIAHNVRKHSYGQFIEFYLYSLHEKSLGSSVPGYKQGKVVRFCSQSYYEMNTDHTENKDMFVSDHFGWYETVD